MENYLKPQFNLLHYITSQGYAAQDKHEVETAIKSVVEGFLADVETNQVIRGICEDIQSGGFMVILIFHVLPPFFFLLFILNFITNL